MSRLSSLCGQLILVTLATALVTSMPVRESEAWGQNTSKEQSNKMRELDQLIDALANRNREPKIVRVYEDWLSLFDEHYDWKEQDRVVEAIKRIVNNASAEMWMRLVARGTDARYCLTLNDEAASVYHNRNLTVGRVCQEIADYQLRYPVEKATDEIGFAERPIHLPLADVPEIPDWGATRSKKPFFELQIALCQQAIKDLPNVEAAAKKSARDAKTDPETLKRSQARLEGTIEKLKKKKNGDFGKFTILEWRYELLRAQDAIDNREKYEEAKKRGEIKDDPAPKKKDKPK